jgi:hypothetical protein
MDELFWINVALYACVAAVIAMGFYRREIVVDPKWMTAPAIALWPALVLAFAFAALQQAWARK